MASLVSRLAAIPLSVRLSPFSMLVINLVVRFLALTVLSCVSLEPLLMWVGIVLMGLSCGYAFPTGLLYLSQYVLVTGRVAAVVVMTESITSIVNPPMFGYLFDSPARNWIIYIPLIMALLQAGSLGVMQVYVMRAVRRGDTGAWELARELQMMETTVTENGGKTA